MKDYKIPYQSLIKICERSIAAVDRIQEQDLHIKIIQGRRTITKRRFWLFGPVVSSIPETDDEVKTRLGLTRSSLFSPFRSVAYTLMGIARSSKGTIFVSQEQTRSLLTEPGTHWTAEEQLWEILEDVDPEWLKNKRKQWFPETNTQNEKTDAK